MVLGVVCNLISIISVRLIIIMLSTTFYPFPLSCLTNSKPTKLILARATLVSTHPNIGKGRLANR
ncbi:hypothetical protein F4811DRAFT_540259 [Daldinia bambusicola]|nr:hypothetical protein F4811DRAFT_540259 [Daldinia bambusicola]